MARSRATLAITEAAAMEGQRASPSMTVISAQGNPAFLLPSMRHSCGLQVQALDRAAHGEQRGAEDVVRLDFLDGGDAYGPRDVGMAAEEVAEFLAILSEQRLRVVEVAVLQGPSGRIAAAA